MKIITIEIFRFGKTPKIFSLFFWVTILITLLSYSLVKQYILPKYFFFDEGTISKFIQWGATFKLGSSYSSTAAFYSMLGIAENSLLFTLISAILTISLYIYCFAKSKTKTFSFFEAIVFVFFAFLSVTYMTMLSKEFIVALVILPFIFLVRRGFFGLMTWCLIALLYATYFRTYWFILVPLFLGIYLVFSIAKKPIYLIISVPVALLILSFAFSSFLGADLDSFRTAVNEYRIEAGDDNARTMILPWIAGGGPVVSWINSFITWITLMIPIPLFLLLTPYYIVIASLMSILFFKSWDAFFKILAEKPQAELSACSALIISFTAVQCIFEPDYGSYVKHLSPLYPLFFYVILKSKTIIKTEKT